MTHRIFSLDDVTEHYDFSQVTNRSAARAARRPAKPRPTRKQRQRSAEVREPEAAYYAPPVQRFTVAEQKAMRTVIAACEREARRDAQTLTDQSVCAAYWAAHFAGQQYETFCGAFLDNQHRLIQAVTLARGTIDAAAVYPREVVKQAIALNATAVIFAHNHPSGTEEPSTADRLLTDRLRQALALVDVRVLDHFVVGGGKTTSFAVRGWL